MNGRLRTPTHCIGHLCDSGDLKTTKLNIKHIVIDALYKFPTFHCMSNFRFRKSIRRAVKTEHVKKNEHNYVTVRSQVRSEAMYTIPERNEGASYQEPNETNMID